MAKMFLCLFIFLIYLIDDNFVVNCLPKIVDHSILTRYTFNNYYYYARGYQHIHFDSILNYYLNNKNNIDFSIYKLHPHNTSLIRAPVFQHYHIFLNLPQFYVDHLYIGMELTHKPHNPYEYAEFSEIDMKRSRETQFIKEPLHMIDKNLVYEHLRNQRICN